MIMNYVKHDEVFAAQSWTASRQHFVCSPSFQLLRHFYTRVIAFFGLLHPPNERSIRKTQFPPFITYVQRPVAPVIERLVRTIVTPWSGIAWAYYPGCNCTVDVITTRCLCAIVLTVAITWTNLLWFWTVLHFLSFYLIIEWICIRWYCRMHNILWIWNYMNMKIHIWFYNNEEINGKSY